MVPPPSRRRPGSLATFWLRLGNLGIRSGMPELQPPGAFPSSLLSSVAARLNLTYAPWMQDWPVEVVRREDLERTLEYYERHNGELAPAERQVIMHVLLACLDQHREHCPEPLATNLAARVADAVCSEGKLCDPVLRYWVSVYWRDDHSPDIAALRKRWVPAE